MGIRRFNGDVIVIHPEGAGGNFVCNLLHLWIDSVALPTQTEYTDIHPKYRAYHIQSAFHTCNKKLYKEWCKIHNGKVIVISTDTHTEHCYNINNRKHNKPLFDEDRKFYRKLSRHYKVLANNLPNCILLDYGRFFIDSDISHITQIKRYVGCPKATQEDVDIIQQYHKRNTLL